MLCAWKCCGPFLLSIAVSLMFWSYYFIVGEIIVRKSFTWHWIWFIASTILFVLMFWSFFTTSGAPAIKVSHIYKLPEELCSNIKLYKDDKQVNTTLTNFCQDNHIRLWTRTYMGNIR